MVDLSTLALFLVAVLALFLSPGPNMAFVLSHGMAHGPRAGVAAAAGITAADLVLTVLTATGFTAIVAAWPPSFDLLRYLGAAYLVWLAIQAIRSPGRATITQRGQVPLLRVFRMAMLNSLLNPKALLFFMVFLPQFVEPSRGHIALQLAILLRNPRASRLQGWLLGGVMATLAVRLLLLDRPAPR